MIKYDVIIIGAGPAGIAAAIFAARGTLSVLVIDESAPAGGTVKNTYLVANYPGFPEPISGLDLTKRMFNQAKSFGAKFELAIEITDYNFKDDLKWIEVDNDEKFESENIIIATGISPRRLNLPGEQEFKGCGIHYCAACDGDFYSGKDIAVIGAGDTAMNESLVLLKYVNSITFIHHGFHNLRAEKCTVDQVMCHKNVAMIWNHESLKFERDGNKMIITAENLDTKEIVKIKRDALFIFVGMKPNSEWLKNSGIHIDERGYIPTDENCITNLKNVYAIGDIRVKKFNQITTAVADGTIAALEIIQKSSCSL
ncbi:MAG: FAD-dependent oxidoreductase [Candidatus Lokiarchaeota archaeon]|nr:FAD-dependent oxidoreductase [Candidatus Lokiarchaeota archaeon]